MLRSARPLVSLLCVALSTLASAEPSSRPATTCAIITTAAPNDPLSAITAIAETGLGALDVTTVDRQNIRRILDERQLQRLLAPDAVAARAEAGRMLRADLLALVMRSGDRGECVIIAARQGVRLARLDLDPARPDAAAAAITKAVGDAAGRVDALHRNEVPLVAVPPFVSGDLLYESDYLRAAYASLAEGAVRRRGGVTIEWREANALAAEAMVADGGAPLQRAMPVYLNGEFRSTIADGKPAVAVTVRCVRGKETLWTASETLPRDAVPAFVSRAGERAAGSSTPTTDVPDPATESARLAARADVSARLGEWTDAAAMYEAALLLKPDDPAVHRLAVIAYTRITRRVFPPLHEANPEDVRVGCAAFFRGLDHLETYLAHRTAKQMEAERQYGGGSIMGDLFHSISFRSAGHPTPETVAALEKEREKAVERLLNIAEWRARQGQKDDRAFVIAATGSLPDDAEFDVALRAVKRMQHLPGLAQRVFDYGCHGYVPSVLDTPAGRRYLDAVEALPSAEAKWAARKIRATLPKIAADAQRSRAEFAAATRPVSRPAGEVSTYRRLTYDLDGGGRLVTVARLVAAGEGVDVLLGHGGLYLSKAKGRAAQIWTMSERNTEPASLCFDGRYAWATYTRWDTTPLLIRVDPTNGATMLIGEAEGLPQPSGETLERGGRGQRLIVGPLSPGRVMLAGYFGRSYLATADTDAAGRVKVSIFHEAREQLIDAHKDQWRRTTVAFEPSCIVPVRLDKGPDGKPMTRVLVARGVHNGSYLSHPLLVDPDTKQVSVIEDDVYLRDERNVAVRDGVLYFAWPTWNYSIVAPDKAESSATVWRMALPAMRKEKVCDRVYPHQQRVQQFACTFLGDKFVVAAIRTNVADTPAGPYTPEGSVLPFPPKSSHEKPFFARSAHYGLLLHMENGTLFEMTHLPASAD